MKRFTALALALSLASAAYGAETYPYLRAQELEQKLRARAPVIVLDIQVEAEYRQHHVKGALPTYAYPVKSAEDKAKLDGRLKVLAGSPAPVVIVCPRGAGGAERTFDYLRERGVPAGRLYILEKGQAGWTVADLTEGS